MSDKDFRNKITKHFRDQLAGDLEKVTVDEWEMDIYYKKTYPFAVESKIIQLQSEGKVVEALVEAILQKCLTPDGKKLFAPADRNMLMFEADPAVILQVANAINNTIADYEEVGKN